MRSGQLNRLRSRCAGAQHRGPQQRGTAEVFCALRRLRDVPAETSLDRDDALVVVRTVLVEHEDQILTVARDVHAQPPHVEIEFGGWYDRQFGCHEGPPSRASASTELPTEPVCTSADESTPLVRAAHLRPPSD